MVHGINNSFKPSDSGYIKFTFNSTTGASNSSLWVGIWVEEISDAWYAYQQTSDVSTNWVYRGPNGSAEVNKGHETSGFRRFKFYFDTGSIAPGIEKASILITNWSPIANHNTNNSAFVTWNGVSNQSSSVVASANGNNKTYSNGDPSNTDRRKPADVSVGSGSQFVYKVTRSNALPSSDTDQVTVYTYTYPSINNLKYESPSFTKDKNIINANHLLKLSWESNSPLCDSKSSSNKKGTSKSTSDKHKTILKIKDSNTTEVDNTSTGTSVQKSANIPATSIQKYVPFDSSKPLGEEVTLTLTKSHANDDSIQKSILNKKLTVRYIPTEEIIWPTENKQTGFTLNHPYPTGAI